MAERLLHQPNRTVRAGCSESGRLRHSWRGTRGRTGSEQRCLRHSHGEHRRSISIIPNTLRFPHGLIRFGETLEECAKRLVKEQLGSSVKKVRIVYWDSYVDDFNHWHIEPGAIVELKGTLKVPKQASEIVSFDLAHVPEMTFWPKSDFLELAKEHMPELIGKR